jgi:hypothetical protein
MIGSAGAWSWARWLLCRQATDDITTTMRGKQGRMTRQRWLGSQRISGYATEPRSWRCRLPRRLVINSSVAAKSIQAGRRLLVIPFKACNSDRGISSYCTSRCFGDNGPISPSVRR